MDDPCGTGRSASHTAVCNFATPARCTVMGPAATSVSAHPSVARGRCTTVARTIASTVGETRLCAPASSRPQAQLRHARNAQLIGQGSRSERRRGTRDDGALGRSRLSSWRSAGDNELTHPVGTLIARTGAAWSWSGAHSRWLDRHAGGFQHLVGTVAEQGRLLATRVDAGATADPVHLGAGVGGHPYRVSVPRARSE